MSYRAWLANLRCWCFRSKSKVSAHSRGEFHPRLELLEDRAQPSVVPIHLYDLNGSLTDALGGPSLVADGGTLNDTRYVFGANQGLRLSGGLADTTNYSIAFVCNLNTATSFFKKLLDFQARTNDSGLYVAGTRMQLFPGGPGVSNVPANTDFHVTLTRESATGLTRVYFNGVLDVTYSGSASSGAVSANNLLTFFEDDLLTQTEAVAGSVDYIAIFDRPLTAAEVADLSIHPPKVAPTIGVDQAALTVNEGQLATNTGTWSHVSSLSSSVGAVTLNSDGTWDWSFTTSDGTNQTQSITITALGVNGTSVATTFDLTVNNVAPFVAVAGAEVAVEEGQLAFIEGIYSDVGQDLVTLTASVGAVTSDGSGGWNWSFNTADGPAETQVVTITATDDDGAATTVTFQLTVHNAAPTITSLTASTLFDQATLTGTFADAGRLDTHTVFVSWGDGSPEEVLDSIDQVNHRFTGTHRYLHAGVFTITVTVRDNDGDVVSHATTTSIASFSGVRLVDGVLYVNGSSGKDVIRIDQFRGQVPHAKPGRSPRQVLRLSLQLNVGSGKQSRPSFYFFEVTEVKRLVIATGSGNDEVRIAKNVTIDATIVGEDHLSRWTFDAFFRRKHRDFVWKT